MAKKFGQGFEITGYEPIDVRLILTKEQMANIVGDEDSGSNPDDFAMPEIYFAFCIDDGCFYKFDYEATPDPETGKFTKLELGGGTPTAESGGTADMPDPDDRNPGDKYYDKDTGKTYILIINSEGEKEWIELTPKAGDMMFDESTGKILYFDGTEWKEVGGLNSPEAGDTAPANPEVGQQWLDTSVNPPVLKYWDGSQWQEVQPKAGDMMYDEDGNQILYYDGTQWKQIGGGVEKVEQLPANPQEGEIYFDSEGGYKIYEDGVWLTLAKTWEGTEAQYTTLGGDTWSTAHPDVIMFVK